MPTTRTMSDLAPEMAVAAPHLRRDGGPAELVVDGRRLLIRGAEVHNSSASTASAARVSFARAAAVGANAVLAPIAWEDLEPSEGDYDLAVVDRLVAAARDAGLHLIVLWFGAFKNGASSYAPSWVKTDTARFPRCVDAAGVATPTLSPFVESTRAADSRAFATLVARIEEIDAVERTVVMVQVENESGLLGHSRDHGAAADVLFAGRPPREVLEVAGVPGDPRSWSEAFEAALDADEHFMTWGFATYVGAVARAGRERSPLPFFTNAWLDSDIDLPGFPLAGGQKPGDYPSGGPVARMLPLWRALAPDIDLVTPDVYFGDVEVIYSDYGSASGGLFIPEMRRDAQGAGDAFLAIGRHGAIGVAPFGVDSLTPEEAEPLRDAYALLAAIDADLASTRVTRAFHLPPSVSGTDTETLDFGDVVLVARRLVPFGDVTPPDVGAFGIVIRLDDTTFRAVGRGFALSFDDPSEGVRIGILSVLEHPLATGGRGREVLRRLNGDESAGGSAWIHPAREQHQSKVFPIPMSLDHSGLSTVRIYRYS